MKDRIKKFYEDHERTLNIIGSTAMITTVVVSKLAANAEAKKHDIIGIGSLVVDDKEYLMIKKQNGQIIDRFSRSLTTES